MRSPDLHYWTALLPVFYNAPHRGDDFPASDPRQPRIILSPLLRSTTPAVNRLHGPLNLIWHLRWSQCLAWMYYPDLHPREVSIPFLGLACCTFPCNQHRAREQQEKAKQNPRPHPSLPSLSTPSLPPPGPRGRGSAPGARGRWAGAGCSWTGSRRRNAAWGLGDRLLSLLLPTPSRNPSPNFLLWSSRGGAGMQAWTSEPAQSSGSWARARCSWTSYPRRNAAWGLGRHFLSPLLPSLVRKSQFLENYRVLLGNTQLYQHTRHTQKIPVSQIIVYPDFDKFHPFGNDIAMLQLLFPVNFTSYIIPACLPAPCMQLPSNSSCWITGWGMLSEERKGAWERPGGR
ncbi:uncharacterized protein LOC116151603 isoform X2 [Camelus dromedarius]|uniref:uncharacterized protein LOC116151603 isoform X2 n=2 Tax=Camelus dromedarius TaxID=9838 RepID=UPI003119EDD9